MTNNKNSFRNTLMALLGGVMLCVACGKEDNDNPKDEGSVEDEPKSAACEIVSFIVNGEAWNISGTDISKSYPAGTVETSLTPLISLSPGATVNPPAYGSQNFFTEQGVSYTVTAEDGVTTKTYIAKASVELSASCEIVSFSVNGEYWDINGTDITHSYPAETALTPAISLSPGARVNPPASEAQNFFTEQGVSYTVTAEDGVTAKTYTARATVQSIASGITGDCRWTLTGVPGNYTLTIAGNGAMANYSNHAENPWYQYWNSIKTVLIQDGVTSVGERAFDGCNILSSVSLGNSVKTIGNHAFVGCISLPSIAIPNSVTAIGEYAFWACDNMSSMSLGNSVKTIGNRAFLGCSSLRSVTIPNSVTTIEDGAFHVCSSLTSVTIGNSVTVIGSVAFAYCSSLTSVTCLGSAPPQNTDNSAFDGVNLNACTLKVPASAVNAYKAAAVWKEFGEVI